MLIAKTIIEQIERRIQPHSTVSPKTKACIEVLVEEFSKELARVDHRVDCLKRRVRHATNGPWKSDTEPCG